MTTTPAFTRLDVDERRRQLLETGARVFTERSYDEVSMSDLAREAGISKGLLYHYFPSKRDYFGATLAAAAAELAAVTEPDPALPPAEQLAGSLDAQLALPPVGLACALAVLVHAARGDARRAGRALACGVGALIVWLALIPS